MAPKGMSVEDIRRQAAELDLDEAYSLREESEKLRKRIAANKAALNNAVTLGHLSDEQANEVLMDLYPERERASAAERVEKLREQLAKAEARASKELESATIEGSTTSDEVVADAA